MPTDNLVNNNGNFNGYQGHDGSGYIRGQDPRMRSNNNNALRKINYNGWGDDDDVTVSRGDTIDSAIAQVYVYSTSYDDSRQIIHGHDVDASAALPASAGTDDIEDRCVTTPELTSASTTYDASSVGVGFDTLPDLLDEVQEIVNRSSWDERIIGICFIGLTGLDVRYRWRGGNRSTASERPKLDVTYTPAAAGFVPFPNPRGTRGGMGKLVGGKH